MSTYKGIQGYSVQKLATDPTASEAVGQLWYNSTSATFKLGVEGAGAWASAGDLNTPRNTLGAAGNATVPTALAFGGSPGSGSVTATEKYDGTTWTEVADLTEGMYGMAGFGVQTAAVSAGGVTGTGPTPTGVDLWDGTSWTAGTGIPTAITNLGGTGTQTAGVIFGGTPPASGTNAAVLFNGTAWTITGSLTTARWKPGPIGTQTAAFAVGGGPGTANVESFDGSTWSEENNINTTRRGMGSSGTTSLGMIYGGDIPPNTQVVTESWNGTSWSQAAVLATGRSALRGCGTTNTAALAIGGEPPGVVEAWSDPVYTNKTVTVS